MFAEFEFPKLRYPRVYRLVAIVIHDCNGTESGCEKGTLKILEDQAVRSFGGSMGYRCEKVCGNASNEQQISTLADQCLQIIREEQHRGT